MQEGEIKVIATKKAEERPKRLKMLKNISFKEVTAYLASIIILVVVIQKISETNNPKVKQPLKISVFALGKVQPTEYIRSIQYPMIYSSSRIKALYVKENQYIKRGSAI